MTKCVFCGRDENYFKGLNLMGNDGVVYYYCSSKCRKNALKLKRDKRKLKWTESYHEKRTEAREKEAAKSSAKIESKVEAKAEHKTEHKK